MRPRTRRSARRGDKAKREANEEAKREADEEAKRETEDKAKREAEEEAKREAEDKAKREAEDKAKLEAVTEERGNREAEDQTIAKTWEEIVNVDEAAHMSAGAFMRQLGIEQHADTIEQVRWL